MNTTDKEQFYPTSPRIAFQMVMPYLENNKHLKAYLQKYNETHLDSHRYYFCDGVIDDRQYSISVHLKDRYQNIFDPQAGEGHILRYLSKTLRLHNRNYYACEIDPERQNVLRKAMYNCNIIGFDFLSLSSDLIFDLILMNPPFNAGVHHLLKAWHILKSGDIACLLNKETIDNPYTKERQQLKAIIEKHGSVEYIGKAFQDAERKTNVDVVIVRLTKSIEKGAFDFTQAFDFQAEKDSLAFDDNMQQQLAVKQGDIQAWLFHYKECKRVVHNIIEKVGELEVMFQPFVRDYGDTALKVLQKSLDATCIDADSKTNIYNTAVTKLNSIAWDKLFRDGNIKSKLSSGLRDMMAKHERNTAQMQFNEHNIYHFMEMIMLNADAILDKVIVEAFDKMCAFHADNKVHWEGWKTNDCYKVNKKVIIPYCVKIGWTNEFTFDWGSNDGAFFSDIDKALCRITGKDYDTIYKTDVALTRLFRRIGNVPSGRLLKRDSTAYSDFFAIQIFKKGTAHITFKDDKVWQLFNIKSAQGKQWVGYDTRNI